MTSHEQTRNDMTYFTDDLSSAANNLSNGLAEIELNTAQQDMHDFELGKQTLIEEVKEKFFILYKLKNFHLVYIMEKPMQ
jgi:hypothetical protein